MYTGSAALLSSCCPDRSNSSKDILAIHRNVNVAVAVAERTNRAVRSPSSVRRVASSVVELVNLDHVTGNTEK